MLLRSFRTVSGQVKLAFLTARFSAFTPWNATSDVTVWQFVPSNVLVLLLFQSFLAMWSCRFGLGLVVYTTKLTEICPPKIEKRFVCCIGDRRCVLDTDFGIIGQLLVDVLLSEVVGEEAKMQAITSRMFNVRLVFISAGPLCEGSNRPFYDHYLFIKHGYLICLVAWLLDGMC